MSAVNQLIRVFESVLAEKFKRRFGVFAKILMTHTYSDADKWSLLSGSASSLHSEQPRAKPTSFHVTKTVSWTLTRTLTRMLFKIRTLKFQWLCSHVVWWTSFKLHSNTWNTCFVLPGSREIREYSRMRQWGNVWASLSANNATLDNQNCRPIKQMSLCFTHALGDNSVSENNVIKNADCFYYSAFHLIKNRRAWIFCLAVPAWIYTSALWL